LSSARRAAADAHAQARGKTAGSASDQLPKNCSNEGQFSRIRLDVFDTDRKMLSLYWRGVGVPSLRVGWVKTLPVLGRGPVGLIHKQEFRFLKKQKTHFVVER
jgi:hypothetical protein